MVTPVLLPISRSKMTEGFKHTHNYTPVGWDRFDPKPHPGSGVIPPDSPVQKIGQQLGKGKLAFVHIADSDGRHQQVFKASLSPKSGIRPLANSPDASRTAPDADTEMAAWHSIIHDRRGERPSNSQGS